ncbi:hypothetical protein SAMN05428977_10892 [Nitrosomonas sp. Nm166]|nr:hypothetical protein SAMN05428977_10892 [Nitrosomonas sp. Nm166]
MGTPAARVRPLAVVMPHLKTKSLNWDYKNERNRTENSDKLDENLRLFILLNVRTTSASQSALSLSRMAGGAYPNAPVNFPLILGAMGPFLSMSGTVLELKDSPVAILQAPNKAVLLTHYIKPF